MNSLPLFLGLTLLPTLAMTDDTTQGQTLAPTITPGVPPTVCLNVNLFCYMGSWMTTGSNYNATFASFQGIQYAQAPIGDLRFKSPLPYQYSNGDNDVSKKWIFCVPNLVAHLVQNQVKL